MRSTMRHGAPLAIALSASLGAGVLLAAACSSEPDVNYGNPTTLSKTNLPGEAGVEPLACGDGGPVKLPDGGCSVSWKGDLYPKMVGPDNWQCSTAACHQPGKQAPD